MIRKLKSGKYRVYSKKRHTNLGTFNTLKKAKARLKQIEYFKRIK